LAVAKRTGDHFYLAEIYRLQGESIRAHAGPAADSEELFLQSLEVAREQNARSWELRTAISLARLWRDTDKHEQAADLLVPVVGRLREGLSTLDVKEAIALANELDMASSGDHPWIART
jgi:two-component SAPR family response regulator